MNYLIIGSSVAATSCITAIREQDHKGTITVISQENEPCYSRPLISYYLMGKTNEERMVYRDDAFFTQHKVVLKKGVTAQNIDPTRHVVVTDKGEFPYDRLLVATGSRPFVPPMQGLDQVDEKYTFMTWEDARKLKKAAKKGKKVLIIGAGLIGLKCAEGLQALDAHITVIDLAPRVLPTILDERGSEIVQKKLETEGITVHLGVSVANFEKNEAILTDGTRIPFAILVIAVGVRPNTQLVKNSGGAVNKGIVIDSHCKTTLPDIWAAGDCVESHDVSNGSDRILAIFPNASMEGETAGKNMAGEECETEVIIPMNATGLFGLHMITAGTYNGDEVKAEDEDSYKRLFVKDGRLVGFILIGEAIDRAGIYTALVRNRTDLSTIDFPLIAEHPVLMAFAKKERERKLGGKQ